MIEPDWKIHKCTLSITENIEYLGTFVGNRCSKLHVAKRVSGCRKAFYALQGAGLCQQGLETDTAMHVWSATCKTILLYGCDSLSLSKGNIEELDKIQARLLKCIIGIGPRHKTSPLLKALKMFNISEHIDINCLLLLNKMMWSHSAARTFNLNMLHKNCVCPHLLINRVHQTCIRDGPFDIQGGGGLGFFLVTSYFFLSFNTTSYFFSKVNRNKFFIFLKK